jgi:hypothetical protein
LRPTLRGGAVLPLKFARPANELEVNMSSDDTPPDGGNANRPMREALSAALRRLADRGDGQSVETLELVVNALIGRALDGDIPAIREIFDRMDGKSVAGATMDDGPRKVTLEWKDPQDWSTTGPESNSSRFIAGASASPAS